MDLSSLKSLMWSRPSLASYLGNEGFESSALGAASQATTNKISALLEQANLTTSSGDQVTLSAEAQSLLGHSNEGNKAVNGVQKGAQSFFLNFFEDAGVDFSKLSEDAQSFLQGFNSLISDTGATMRDTTTDRMEQDYSKGNRDVYTLLGTNSRLRIAIDYTDDKAQKLTLTDMNGGQVSIAELTIKNAGQTNASIEVARETREYVNGYLSSQSRGAPLSMALYS
jgi:hypothetical protein